MSKKSGPFASSGYTLKLDNNSWIYTFQKICKALVLFGLALNKELKGPWNKVMDNL